MMQSQRVRDAYQSYFRFNNSRTLSTGRPSELSIETSAALSVFRDATRRFDNQIIIHHPCPLDELAHCLSAFLYSPSICVEPAAASVELRDWLVASGFAADYQHQFLALSGADFSRPTRPITVTVERWGSAQADDFLALLKTSGLDCSDELWLQKRSFYCTDSFRCFVAFYRGKACAWATSFIDGELAILANAYTQPAFREQGAQTALLTARIDDARELGVSLFLTDVMLASRSASNCLSLGFHSVGVRQVWEKKE